MYLSVGYKSEKIESYFHRFFYSLNIHYLKENEPLGTGGAIAFALNQINAENVLVINGDTFLNLNIPQFVQSHKNALNLALKRVEQSNRYGFVEEKNNRIVGFTEKSQELKDGWINAGVYIINRRFFLSHIPSQKTFSFEKDFLEKNYSRHVFGVFKTDAYFIDIGIPEDYERAQREFATLKHLDIDKSWTLFLDRDGVINKKLENDYVKKPEELEILDMVPEALRILRQKFGRIIIVTNQQGIGKGIMTEEDLNKVHAYLLDILRKEGIMIDKIYYAPDLESKRSIMRKPNIGMALKAKEELKDIEFSRSIMVGDSLSDIQFAHNAGMYAVYLSHQSDNRVNYDFVFKDLYEFSKCFV